MATQEINGEALETSPELATDERKQCNEREAYEWIITNYRTGSMSEENARHYVKNTFGIDDSVTKQIQIEAQKSAVLYAAATKLYNKLRPDDDSPLTKEKYQEIVKTRCTDKRERKFLLSTGEKVPNKTEVTEVDFVEMVVRRMRSGQIDPEEDEVEMEAFGEADLVRKVTKYPGFTISMTINGMVEFLTTDAVNLAMYAIPFDNLNVVIAFFIISLLSAKFILNVLTAVVFTISFIVMGISTLQIIMLRNKYKQVNSMVLMLKQHSSDLNADSILDDYAVNSTKPYSVFFVSLLCLVPSFYLCSHKWIPCSELCVASLFLSLMLYYKFIDFENDSSYLIPVLHIGSVLPKLVGGFPYIPLLSEALSLATGNLLSIELSRAFLINISLPAVCLICIPAFCVHVLASNSWAKCCRTLLPILVAMVWMHVCLTFYTEATFTGLVRGSIVITLLCILLPVVPAIAVVYAMYHAVSSVGIFGVIKILTTLTLICLPIVLSLWQDSGFGLGSLSIRGRSLKFKFLFILTPMLLLGVGTAIVSDGEPEDVPFVEWGLYSELCVHHNEMNSARAQLKCRDMQNMAFMWTGTVRDVQITGVENAGEAFLEMVPDPLASWIKCLYGGTHRCRNHDLSDGDTDQKLCELVDLYDKQCTFSADNVYSYILIITMETVDGNNVDIKMAADDDLGHDLLNLKPGDVVTVAGVLLDKLGTLDPVIGVSGVMCESCDGARVSADKQRGGIMHRVKRCGFKTINFFTDPFLEYTSKKRQKVSGVDN